MQGGKRRVAYGVHGYGRGHAVRAQAVLPLLRERHDVLVLAGDEAADLLSADYRVHRLPTLRYVHDAVSNCSAWLTLRRNVPLLADAMGCGRALRSVMGLLREFAPHVVISDSELFTHRAAWRMGIPRISFDHYGVLASCDVGLTGVDRVVCELESLAYRLLVNRPHRSVATAFFSARPLRRGVRIVPPVLREIVRRTRPSDGSHLLVYLSNAHVHFTPTLRRALAELDADVRVYGPAEATREGRLEIKPLSVDGFVQDLASCRAVFATAGNQLIGEAIHFGKGMLLLPEQSLEQRLNARFVQQWGIGRQVSPGELSTELFREFLAGSAELAARVRAYQRDGLAEAVAAIEQAIGELSR